MSWPESFDSQKGIETLPKSKVVSVPNRLQIQTSDNFQSQKVEDRMSQGENASSESIIKEVYRVHRIRSIVDDMELKLRLDRDSEGDDTDDDVKDKIERIVRIKNLLNDIDQKFDDSTDKTTQLPAVNDIDTVSKRFKHCES